MKKTNMHLWLALWGVLVLCFPMQAAFQDGYVVTTSGDTLKGGIDLGSSNTLVRHCRFKSAENGEVTRYKPQELKSFAITGGTGRRFVSGTVPYFLKDRDLFLEVLQAGRLNLYYTYDLVLNDLFYVSRRDAKPVDVLFDWDKSKLIPFKSDYVEFLKKAMVDAPEMLLDIERINKPTKYALSELVGKYNRRFDKTAKTTTASVQTTPVEKPKKRLGLSISPGIVVPKILYIDDIYMDAFGGVSVTKGPSEYGKGFYLSAGVYKPIFGLTTKNGKLETFRPFYRAEYSYLILAPIHAAYRFSQNKLQPMLGLDWHTYFSNEDTRFLLGPSFGLCYTPIKWVSLSCSVQYGFSEFYTKSIRYQTTTTFNLTTDLSINL